MKIRLPTILLQVCGMLAAGWLGGATAASAQDALPSNPPEMRDFKLEPAAPAPKPPPLPPSPTIEAEPQPAKPAPAPKPAAEAKNGAAREPSVAANASPKAAVSAPVRPKSADVTMPPEPKPRMEPAGNQDEIAAPEGEGKPEPPSAPAAAEPEISQGPVSADQGANSLAGWQWILAGAAALAAGFAIFAYRRRRKAKPEPELPAFERIAIEPEIEPNSEPRATVQLVAPPSIKEPADRKPATAKAAVDQSNRPQFKIDFAPTKATISLANLTIDGKLHIQNTGTRAANTMQIRAAIISANEQQQKEIDQFFESVDEEVETLDGAAIGEKIVVDLNLVVPLSEISAFQMRGQQMFVPIMLAQISYQWSDGGQTGDARFSCLIGREAEPPQLKMGAFRLDVGPRSIRSLGQRPIFAK